MERSLFGFDVLDIGWWLERVAKTKDDLDFYELCVEYVAGLNDTHDSYSLTGFCGFAGVHRGPLRWQGAD